MKKLTVWLSEQEQDNQCYNIVARTRREALEQIKQRNWTTWSKPKKVVVEYKDAFDLFEWVTGEGGGRHSHL